jgi:excisionase family DNA binding protein
MVSFVEPKEKLYKMNEASSLLGVHPNTIRRWEKQGKIKSIRAGAGHRKIPEGEINRIMRGVPPSAGSTIPLTSDEELAAFLNFVFSRHRDDWDLVKKAVIIRDNYSCQGCGGQEMLTVHHKDGSGRNVPENLVTLCQKCYDKIHGKPTFKPEKPKIKVEKDISPQNKQELDEKKPISAPRELSRQAILDSLLSPGSGLVQRTVFGEILSTAMVLKRFTVQDLTARARCPEPAVKSFCEIMEQRGYAKRSDGSFEITVEVLK